MSRIKIKNKKPMSNLDKFDIKINSIIDALIPAIIIMIPVIFILYVLNIHGYFFPKGTIIFRLHNLYRYMMFILGGIYLYKVIFKKVIITKSDIFLYIFMFFTILSTIFATNTEVALFGYPGRFEGMYTLLFYCFLYLNCKLLRDKTDVKYLIKMLVSVAIIHFLVVIMQLTGIYGELIYQYTSGDAIGLTENCNFLGSLMCLISSICLCGYLLYNKKENQNYFLFILIISYSTLLLANSSGPFLSFLVTLILVIIVLLIKKLFNFKKVLIVLVIVVTLYPVCLFKKDEITPEIILNVKTVWNLVFKNDEKSLDSDFNSESDTNKENNNFEIRKLGNGRIKIWINVWKLIEEKPLLGYGPDNLGLVYEKSSDDTKIADKAHNIYLHILVSSGAFALLSYLLWIISTIYLGLKSKNTTVLILCFGIIAYSIQGLFNINVSEVTPYFYITLGLMMFLIDEKSYFQIKTKLTVN